MKPRTTLFLLAATAAATLASIPSIADACAKSKSTRVVVVVQTPCDVVSNGTSSSSTSMQDMLCDDASTTPASLVSGLGPTSGGTSGPPGWYPLIVRVGGSGAPFLTVDHGAGLPQPPPNVGCACGIVMRATGAAGGPAAEVIGGAVVVAGTMDGADSFPAGFQAPEANSTHAWKTELANQGLLSPAHEVFGFNLMVNGHPTPDQRVEFVYLLRVPRTISIDAVKESFADGLALTAAIDNSTITLMDVQTYAVESVD